MMRRAVSISFLILLAGSVCAILPPDAPAREPQLRVYRQRLNENYEKRLVERQAEAVRAYEQTRADIFTPPWLREKAQKADRIGVDPAAAARAEKARKRKHRILVSIVLLILISSAVGWVRYATREQNE